MPTPTPHDQPTASPRSSARSTLHSVIDALPGRQLSLALFALLLLLASLLQAGFRYQTTASAPRGIYQFKPSPLTHGAWVAICPDDAATKTAVERGYLRIGPCAGAVQPLLKRVVALPGDVVTVSTDGIAVNDTPLPHSAPLDADRHGATLDAVPPGRHEVAERTLWAINPDPRSWDSRYFGPVAFDRVLSVADAVVTWGD